VADHISFSSFIDRHDRPNPMMLKLEHQLFSICAVETSKLSSSAGSVCNTLWRTPRSWPHKGLIAKLLYPESTIAQHGIGTDRLFGAKKNRENDL
jgi:hypothetical protein